MGVGPVEEQMKDEVGRALGVARRSLLGSDLRRWMYRQMRRRSSIRGEAHRVSQHRGSSGAPGGVVLRPSMRLLGESQADPSISALQQWGPFHLGLASTY